MGLLDVKLLSIVDLVYDRGVPYTKPDPDAWKKWYPHPETLGLVNLDDYPKKPELPVHPIFPKATTHLGFDYQPMLADPTIMDAFRYASWHDYFLGSLVWSVIPIQNHIYAPPAIRYRGWKLAAAHVGGLLSGAFCVVLISSGTLYCSVSGSVIIYNQTNISAAVWIQKARRSVIKVVYSVLTANL